MGSKRQGVEKSRVTPNKKKRKMLKRLELPKGDSDNKQSTAAEKKKKKKKGIKNEQ